ncbi:hypothetical protein TraAM80_04562 [Trypanosoma rangeli]|uniref:Uncharacterized protein n=1 Tax=Trypanosoma rangeli TaxID=5698 RepID=A0A422NIR1_TRYRA|nr:uncharacterized protein TraAM80_04562 [Trypanosoma rangeli]RNF05363.1 hypothetical protein TraAM80_04562 [Trypanosoma rangeli]|eukprot:RNF05363.1 hypothetical protein TraAM80_04562 [Trypanosoma rangeli]
MRCAGCCRVVVSAAATTAIVSAAPFCLRRGVSTDGRATVAPPNTGLQAMLQQLRRRFHRDAPGANDAAAEKLGEAAVESRPRAPALRQIITECEEMCDAERPVVCSMAEWSEAVHLLLYAMARAGREAVDDGVTTRETSTPWCVALRLFLHSPPAQGASDAEKPFAHSLASGVSLLRCCVRHGAPLHVGRAVYQTLRSSVSVTSETPLTGWHVPYARFLLLKAAEEEEAVATVPLALHKEALRVLLLDAAEDGEMLQPAGLLLSLEVLRRLVTWGGAAGENDNMQHKVGASGVEDALWCRLQRGADIVVVARDVCCCVLRNRHASHAMKREAFCRFIAVGMRLSLEELHPFLCSVHRNDGPATAHKKTALPFLLETLQAVTEILSGVVADVEAVGDVLAEPSEGATPSRSPATPCFASVWLVDHILQGLASLQRQAITADGAKESRRCAVEAWTRCTRAALRCLQRVLLHLPDGRCKSLRRQQREQQHARQQAFCMLFHAALNGVFHSLAESESPALAQPQFLDVVSTLMQAYREHDWRWPSVDVCIECLHAWRRHSVLRRVFCEAQRRDERRWHAERRRNGNSACPVNDLSTIPTPMASVAASLNMLCSGALRVSAR